MWSPGRQGGGYNKLTIWNAYPKWDCYLLHMSTGAKVPWHKDELPDKTLKHFRLNFLLKKPQQGGEFLYEGHRVKRWFFNRVVLFRPDNTAHRVTEVTKGTRWVLSIGFTKKLTH